MALAPCHVSVQTKQAADGRRLSGMATSGIKPQAGPSWYCLICDGTKDVFLSGIAPSMCENNTKLKRGGHSLRAVGVF